MPKIPTKVVGTETTETMAFERWGREFPAPFWVSVGGEAVLYHGHVVDQLARLPSRSVHMCVTSPPYYALRDYGTATWEGGSETCDHVKPFQPRSERPNVSASGIGRGGAYADEQAKGTARYRDVCGKCGAKRIDKQIGAESSPDCGTHGQAQCGDCFVCSMVAVFREVRRVLRDDGTCWLNLGSSYWSGGRQILKDALEDCAREVRAVEIADNNVTLVLREDLTTDEVQYVLSEIMASLR